jgi:hypothetical protein
MPPKNIGISAGLLALFALAVRISVTPNLQSETPKPQPPGANTAKKDQLNGGKPQTPAECESSIEGPWLATRSFFARNQTTDCPGKPGFKNNLQQLFGFPSVSPTTAGKKAAPGPPVQAFFLIATVPDPIHTRLAYLTDGYLEAIQAAAAQAGWVFASQWLPWNDPLDPDEKGVKNRQFERKAVREEETEPGVLVFRYSVDKKTHAFDLTRVLLVFVVGETPALGVNGNQLKNALEYRRGLPAARSGMNTEINILAPSFSASFYSLSGLIQEDTKIHPESHYNVQDGSASSSRAASAFQKVSHVRFRSSALNTDDQREALVRTVKSLGLSNDEVASLVDDSDYGQAVGSGSDADAYRTFQFPRDISVVRNAYKDASQSGKPAATPEIEFSLKDPASGEDTLPVFSKSHTPVVQNSVLNQIVDDLRNERIRLVQVSATNVLDSIFLAGLLRRQCPDIRLFIPFPHLLFVQAEDKTPLIGSLFVSNYPMFDGPGPKHQQMIIPDSGAIAIYNSAAILLESLQSVRDYQWDRRNHPPTWVLMLDRQGFEPVSVSTHSDERETSETWYPTDIPLKEIKITTYPLPSMWVFLSGALALVSFGLFIWVLWLSCDRTLIAGANFDLNAGATDSAADEWRLVYLTVIVCGMLAIHAALLLPVKSSPQFDLPWSVAGLSYTAIAANAGLLLAAICCLLAQKRVKAGLLGIVVTVGTLIFGLLLWSQCQNGSDNPSHFFAQRALGLHLGSSPIWPIVAAIAGIVLLARMHLTRLHLAASQEPQPAIDVKTSLQERLEDSYLRFRDSTRSLTGLHASTHLVAASILFIVTVVMLYIFQIHRDFASIDGTLYDILRLGLQFVLITGLLSCAWQIQYLWRHLQTFVTGLNSLPIQNFFTRTFPPAGNRPIWVRRISVQSLSTPIRAAVIMSELAPQVQSPYRQWKSDFQHELQELLKMNADGNKKTRSKYLEQREDLRRTSLTIAREVFKDLYPQWAAMPLAEEYFPTEFLKKIKPNLKGAVLDPADDVYRLRSTLLALHYTPYLIYGVRQIQNLALGVSLGFPFLIFSVSTYEMQSPQLASRVLMFLFAAVATVLWMCLTAIERNAILSKIAGSTPGELNKEFYFKFAGYLGAPALGLLASQFPAISNFLTSWIEPTLEAVR